MRLAYGSSDRREKVKKWSSNLVRKYPKNPRAHLLKGLVFEMSGDNRIAIASYVQATNIDPSFKQGFESLGTFYLSNRQLDEALSTYSRLVDIDPKYSAGHVHVANVYLLKNNLSKATQHLEQAVELDPKDVVAQYNLANIYLQTNQTPQAIRVLQTIVELDPTGKIGSDAKTKLVQFTNKSNQISVTATRFRLVSGGGINNRYEVAVTLVIQNNGKSPFSFDEIVGRYFVNGKGIGASKTSLMQLTTLDPGRSEEHTLQSMASGFGSYIGDNFEKKIEIYLLRNESKVFGPLIINVPDSFGY